MGKASKTESNNAVRQMTAVLSALAVLFFYIVVLGASSIASAAILSATHPEASADEIKEMATSCAAVTGIVGNVAALALLTAAILIMKRKIAPTLSMKRFSPLLVPVCIVIGASFNLFSECALSLIPFSKSAIDSYKEIYSYLGQGSLVPEVISIVFVTPVVEEIFFRGCAYRLMRRRCGVVLSVILSSLLFGAAHGNLLSLVYATALGVVLALSFEATGSVFVPILIHSAFNAASYLADALMGGGNANVIVIALVTAALCAAGAAAFYIISKKYKNNSQSHDGTGTE